MHLPESKLKTILLSSGLIDEDTFGKAKEEALRQGQTVADVLIGQGSLTEEYFVELLEPALGVPLVDLKKVSIPREVLELIPEAYAKSKQVILFEQNKEKGLVKVAMLDPFDYEVVEFLRAKSNAWIEPYLTTSQSLKYGLKQYKQRIATEFHELIAENVQKALSVSGETDVTKLAEAVPIVTILDSIMEHAVSLNASDIHFEPFADQLLARFRIDGILHEILTLHKVIETILVARVKILANMQIDEHRIPQDGRFRFEQEEGSVIDIRVNVMPVLHGEKVEMRLLKSSARPFTLEDLGLSPESAQIIAQEIKKPHGMMLVTGPTGHGKTTTLYSVLHMLNTPLVNITTIEDPIEYEVPRINQTQVNVKSGITFANGLRSLLRQNPDILMVGEIRDNETVEIAIHAALTGHLVLSTLHTNDAPAALPRLIDMGAPPFLLVSTINMVIAQRLVRKLCADCVESYPLSPEVKRLIEAQITLMGDIPINLIPSALYRGKGCRVCGGSGFHGQIGVFEILRVSDAIKERILKLAPLSEIRKQAVKEGMTSMFEDGMKKVAQGVTTVEEVIRVVQE